MLQTLLIVDDSEPLHELVKVLLGTEEFAFKSVYRGSTALDIAASLQPDLILLDVDLPDMNGFDVCRFLKSNSETSRIPVAFLTASRSTDEELCGLELQAADFITKPFDHFELVYRVHVALQTKGPSDLHVTGDGSAGAASRLSSAPATNEN